MDLDCECTRVIRLGCSGENEQHAQRDPHQEAAEVSETAASQENAGGSIIFCVFHASQPPFRTKPKKYRSFAGVRQPRGLTHRLLRCNKLQPFCPVPTDQEIWETTGPNLPGSAVSRPARARPRSPRLVARRPKERFLPRPTLSKAFLRQEPTSPETTADAADGTPRSSLPE